MSLYKSILSNGTALDADVTNLGAAQLASYKGMIVSVQHIKTKSITLHRQDYIDLNIVSNLCLINL